MYFFRHIFLCLLSVPAILSAQALNDNFEGNGNISTWAGDGCGINTRFVNTFKNAQNTSDSVMSYADNGGLYANVRFDASRNFSLLENYVFTLKIYIPSSGLTGSQNNQISLKLQDGTLAEPWSTQSEIIKNVVLNQWQTITFNFKNDNYLNLNGGSLPPTQRADFNRVVLQINGENNTNNVRAYIDDFVYEFVKIVDNRNYSLVWSDEFNGSGAIDNNKWFHQTQLPQAGSWYNGEVQHYTNRNTNSFMQNGNLSILAKKENFTDQGFTKNYTSARLNSKFAFKYGRVEFRAKLPSGVGTWPALWMLGKNIDENGAYWDNMGYGNLAWPACGEVDIMEHWGNNQNYVQSAMHTPSSFGGTVNLGGRTVSTASTAFHVYALEWTAEKMVFSVDSIVHYTYNPSDKNASTWPFDSEQYLLMNVAIQDNIFLGFTQAAMEIDYVRVYQETKSSIRYDKELQAFKIYPNPFKHRLSIAIDVNDIQDVAVEILSLEGQVVYFKMVNLVDGKIEINGLELLPAGLYFLRCTIDGLPMVLKVAKE
jgi:beta-glucanase (GH16 family)